MDRKETTKFLGQLLINTRFGGAGKHWASEVSIDPWGREAKRVDYMQFSPADQCSISGIEKGIFTCYEIKSCKEDVYSGNGLNFLGEKNYIVTTMECYKDILPDLRSGKFSKHMREQFPESSNYFGVMVAIPDWAEATDEFEKPTPLDAEIRQWKLAVILPCRYGPRKRKMRTEDQVIIVEALAGQRETAAEETQALATEFYSYLNAAEASGRITKRQNEHYKDLASQAIRNQKANDLMTSLDFENNTLGGTYGDLISANQGKTQKSMGNEVDYLKNYLKNNDVQSLYDHLNTFGVDYAQQGGGWKWLQSGDQNALEKVWEAMKPDADSMRGLVDEYVKVGQDVPKQIMDKFNETMAIGAASGDTSAAWDVYAKSIADSGDKALIDAVSQMDAKGQLGEEFSAAWKRATASVTDEPVELGDLKAEVDGVDIDKDAWVSSLNEKLGDLAETEDVTAEGATIKVKAGDCLWEIGNALGIDWQTIAEENGIESPYIIHAGDELKISMDNLTAEVDGDAATAAIDQAMSALTAEGAEFSVTADGVKVDLANVEVDSETAMAQIEAALGMETGTLSGAGIQVQSGATVTIPSDLVQVDTSGIEAAVEQSTASGSEDTTVEKQVNVTTTAGSTDTTPVEEAAQAALSSETNTTDTTMTTNLTVEAGSTDATPAATSAQAELDNTFSNTMQTNGSTDVTIEKASDNIAAVYSQVGSELQAAFNSPYSAKDIEKITEIYGRHLGNQKKQTGKCHI